MLAARERLVATLLACLMAVGLQAACTGDSNGGDGATKGSKSEPLPGSSEDNGEEDDDGNDNDDGEDNDGEGEEVPFSESKILIEHNATAADTGFQGFVDGDPWNRLTVTGPDGAAVLQVKGVGRLEELGMTELFFETQEPANDDVPIEDLLALFPEGEYEFEGRSIEGQEVEGEATLSHAIPAGPVVVEPADGSVVDAGAAVVTWNAVTTTITGSTGLEIVGYELIVELDADLPPTAGFSNTNLDIHVPPTVTSLTIPAEFLAPGTAYKFEVLALEASGNQTITEGTFETAE
jgi:hypothetical protein